MPWIRPQIDAVKVMLSSHTPRLIGRLLLCFGAVPGVACGVAVEESFIVREPVRRIVLQLDTGDARVEGTDDDHVQVTVELGGLSSKTPHRRVEDGVLYLDYACERQELCGGDLIVRAPRGVELDARMDRGDLRIDGLRGEVEARMRSGEIFVSDFGGRHLDLVVESGTLGATLVERPTAVTMTTSSGTISLTLPEGAYVLDLQANEGSVETDRVAHDPDADAEITAMTGRGKVLVQGR
jgi:hypothetical protein